MGPADPAPSRPLVDASGILCVDKPLGMTSHDVVGFVRRHVRIRRVGHAGTLDPQASGVLLVCVGQATRVSEYLMNSTKRYRATVRFGGVSTTDDAAGTITPSTTSLADLTARRLEQILRQFIGDIDQVPPAYAAIKVAGQPIYRAARAGRPVQVPARRVRIDAITIVKWSCPDLTIDVTCSKGTYIRALARDLGEAAGTGAYLLNLVRTASGSFTQDLSVPLDEVARASKFGYLTHLMWPIDAAFFDCPAAFLSPEDSHIIRQGRPWFGPTASAGQALLAYSASTGRIFALLRFVDSLQGWQPEKVFPGEANDPI